MPYLTYFYDGNQHRMARCSIDERGRPVGIPEDDNHDILLVIEYEEGHEPSIYDGFFPDEHMIENIS